VIKVTKIPFPYDYSNFYLDLLNADGDYYKQLTIIQVACLQHPELFTYGLKDAQRAFKKCRRKYQRTVYIKKFIIHLACYV
jgi:hypothetical protein